MVNITVEHWESGMKLTNEVMKCLHQLINVCYLPIQQEDKL